VLPYWVVQFAGAICAALFLQVMFGDVSTGGNYPITTPGGDCFPRFRRCASAPEAAE